MAIRRIESDEEDTNTEDTEIKDQEDSRAAREKELEERAHKLELEKARAESALDEARRVREVQTAPAPVVISEEQWQKMESETGMSRNGIQANAQIMKALLENEVRPLSQRASAAEERAKVAEERASKVESRRELDKVEQSFYKKNSVLESHKSDVESFLAEFPETTDPKVYEKRLSLAADYVRGKVKTLRSDNRRGEFSSRQVESNDENDNDREFDGRFDPRGIGGNQGAINLMENVISSYGRGVRHPDSIKKVKEWADDEGRGVSIDSNEELERGRNLILRGSNLGGTRGEK
jgi:hypothetical protein